MTQKYKKLYSETVLKAVAQAARKLTELGIESHQFEGHSMLAMKIRAQVPELEKNSAPEIFFSFIGWKPLFDHLSAHKRLEKQERKAAKRRRRKEKRLALAAGLPKPPLKKLSSDFYLTREWRALRYRVIRTYGPKCMCCGASGLMHVDHIKPRSKYPALELVFDNLQVLCEPCNMGKSNTDETDWRPKPKVLPFAVVKPSKAS